MARWKLMPGYKVVVEDHGHFYSVKLPNKVRLEYDPNKKLHVDLLEYGPITAFSKLMFAQEFIKALKIINPKIWEVLLHPSDITNQLWYHKRINKQLYSAVHHGPFETGTMFGSYIELIQEVKST